MKQKLRYDMTLFEYLDYRSNDRYLKRVRPDWKHAVRVGVRGNVVRKGTYADMEFTSIVILRSVIKIEKNAFLNSKTDVIYYEGSPEEWARIDIEEGNELLDPSIIRFNYTGPIVDE